MFQSKTTVKFEELAYLLLSLYLFSQLPFAGWVYPVFFFAPDLSMLPMLVNKPFGAFTHNVVHHKALAVSFFLAGSLLSLPLLTLSGVLLLGHSSLDRQFGFGFVNAGPKPVIPAA